MAVGSDNSGCTKPQEVPSWLEGIDGESLPRLILSDAPVIRVVAGPGSGKTLGLRRRVQRLIELNEVDPSRIFVGTFTRAITTELARSLDQHVVEGISVRTLHSLAYQLLQSNPAALLGRSLRLMLNFETRPMLYDVGNALPEPSNDSQRRSLLRQLQANYAHKRDQTEAAFAGELERWLIEHRGILIDEIVPLATRGLESSDIGSGQFDHVLIDEYQDLTASEQALVEQIWSHAGSLVVLGDDDQSIYGFRFNHPGGITEFPDRWDKSEFEDIPIPDNHRSSSEIVGAANTMMAEAGPTKQPMVSRYIGYGEVIRLSWPSLDEEVAGLASYINAKRDQEFLVLVPLKLIGNRLKSAIGSDAQTSFNEDLLEHGIVQERFTLASLVANPEDRISLRAWLGFRGDSSETPSDRNCVAYASALNSGLSGLELARAIADGQIPVSGTGRSNVVTRAKKLVEFLGAVPEEVNDKINLLFDPSWANEIEDEEKRRWAQEDLETLRTAALHQAESAVNTPNLADVVNRLRYQIATRAPLEHEENSRVVITTLHSAKGLEAPSVIIAGLADQMLPGYFADLEEREERRRLLYVGITRPRNEMIVSRPLRMRYEEAAQNRVRIDSVTTVNGEKWVKLSRCSLVPTDFPGPQKQGGIWLRDNLAAIEAQAATSAR